MTSRKILRLRIFVGLTICLLLAVCHISVVDAAEARDGIDAILILDTSGSMREADRERTMLEAAQLFIDMLETRNSRVGVIGFTNVLNPVIPLTPVSTTEERDGLRRAIGGLQYNGWTDIGLALRTAAEMMQDQHDPNNSPMIILFTDGDIDLGPAQDVRTDDMSYTDTWWAVDTMSGMDVPIYTIGLNYHGNVNINFLRSIAERTMSRSYIVDQAAGLPLIFSEIFANHIRTSITEIAEFIAEGDIYTDVLIPIPSAFVAEANIIMLSDHPLVNVRLIDPDGNEAYFDGINHILTYANRYSMIKSINPAVGDWTLSVMGLADDLVTINLIYNFDINVSLSVHQADTPGPLLNPTSPLSVTAGFIFADPRIEPSELYLNANQALVHVHDNAMELLQIIGPMQQTHEGFLLEISEEDMQLFAAENETFHLSVHVTHPDFEVSSGFVTVTFGQADTPAPPPAPEPSPAPTPPPAPEPTPEPAPQAGQPGSPILPIILTIAALIAAGVIYSRIKQPKSAFFAGYLEVRAVLEDGMYTALEAPDLSTFPGRTSLYDFLSLSLKSQSERILQSIDTHDIYIQPGNHSGDPVIQLQNKGNCKILDEEGNTIDASKNFNWLDNQRLTFTQNDNAKLEVTYRATED